MYFLAISALATGYLRATAIATDKPLGPASHIYVVSNGPGAPMSDHQVVVFLNRHAVPASEARFLRPLNAKVSKVNELSSMNAVLVISASPNLTLSVFMFKPTESIDTTRVHAVWKVSSKIMNSGLEQLVDKWHKDHGLRTRRG